MECDGSCARSRKGKGGGKAPFVLGALGALAALAAASKRTQLRPWLRGLFREAYGFKEWVSLQVEEAREDFEDIAAEARQEYHGGLKRRIDEVERRRAVLKKLAERGASPRKAESHG